MNGGLVHPPGTLLLNLADQEALKATMVSLDTMHKANTGRSGFSLPLRELLCLVLVPIIHPDENPYTR